jgi:hypothetical protein
MQPVVHNAVDSRVERSGVASAVADVGAQGWAPRVARSVRNVPFQDWWVLSYLLVILAAVLVGKGPGWEGSTRTVILDIAFFVMCLVLVRGELLRRESYLASLVYRIGIFTPTFTSYFQLRYVLPSVTQKALDAEIYAFDMKVFHYEPAVAWDRFVTPVTTEWFAFFYGLYFLILGSHILPFLFFSGCTPRFRHFSNGLLIVFCTAHLLYMVVPGFGPYRVMHYEHELVGGRFWNLVLSAVHQSGALKDIFPSLHTAAPTYITLYSYAHHKELPFKYTWPLMAFVTSQIVIATMFLRWHYLIDIVVGLMVAAAGVYIGGRIARWEDTTRPAAGAQTTFGQPMLGFLLPKKWRWIPPSD